LDGPARVVGLAITDAARAPRAGRRIEEEHREGAGQRRLLGEDTDRSERVPTHQQQYDENKREPLSRRERVRPHPYPPSSSSMPRAARPFSSAAGQRCWWYSPPSC